MVFDFQGTVVSIIQVIALILLIIGVYPYRIRTENRNLIMHGFLCITAIILNLITVFSVMIPVFNDNMVLIRNLPLIQEAVFWLHAVLGAAAIALGLIIIFSWVTHPLGELGCTRMWRAMMPTFIVWTSAVALGFAIHIFNIV
jgi:hypothetical protein